MIHFFMKTRLLMIVAVLWAVAGGASARPASLPATPPAAESEPKPEAGAHTVRFYCLGSQMPQLFYEVKKKQPLQIVGACGSLSKPMPMPTDQVLDIYRTILPPPAAPPGTEPLKQVLASVRMPAGFAQAIILLLPAGDAKTGTLRAAAFGDSYQTHPRQTVRVFNLSALEVGLKIGASLQSFPAGQNGIMPWVGGEENVVAYRIVYRHGGDWVLAGANERAARPNLRAFMFAYTADRGGVAGGELFANIFFDSVPEKK